MYSKLNAITLPPNSSPNPRSLLGTLQCLAKIGHNGALNSTPANVVKKLAIRGHSALPHNNLTKIETRHKWLQSNLTKTGHLQRVHPVPTNIYGNVCDWFWAPQTFAEAWLLKKKSIYNYICIWVLQINFGQSNYVSQCKIGASKWAGGGHLIFLANFVSACGNGLKTHNVWCAEID